MTRRKTTEDPAWSGNTSDSGLTRDVRAWAIAKARSMYRFSREAFRPSRPKPLAVVSLRSVAPGPARRALLSYIIHPFVLPADSPGHLMFSSFGLAKCIARALMDMGFDVDVINYDDVSFRSDEAYDLVIVHGGVNFETLFQNVLGRAKLVYFSTGNHWGFWNDACVARFTALRARRGIDLPLDRFIRHSEQRANTLADGIVCLGNQAMVETYSGFPSVIALNNAAYADGFFDAPSKNYADGRRNFLFFGSRGSVHKGLDVVLEAFTGLDAELYVCQSIEPEFRVSFARELALPNVHDMGWVQLRSAAFHDLMRTCNCTILPSASEGQPGGIIACMHCGLIPIVSRESNVDTGDYGVTLANCSVESVRTAVTETMAKPTAWHEAASRRTYQAAVTDFTPEVFQARFRAAVQTVLDAPGELRRNSFESNRPRSSNTGADASLTPTSADFTVAIDAVFFQWNNTGIARVWDSLFEEWSENGFGFRVLVLDRGGTAPRYPGLSYAPVPAFPAGGSLESDQGMLEEVCRRYEASLFASTYYTFPRETPSLFVAYDMIPEVTGMDLATEQWERKHMAIQHASGFVAISGSTADDLAGCFPSIRRQQIAVARCAVGREFFVPPPEEVQAFRTQYGLPTHYYLFLGDRTGYKNCRLLLEAFASIDRLDQHGLLLVGGPPILEVEFESLVRGRAVVMAALSDAELRLAYAAATALVFPSRYEGFGLPILEAMACGCPVITCSNSSIPEVAGDAAIYVGESDPRQLADAMMAVRDAGVRSGLRDAGLTRVRGFSWARMAETVQREIERVCERCVR